MGVTFLIINAVEQAPAHQTTLHKTLRTANRVKVLSLLPFPKIVSPVISSALLPHPLPSGCFVRKARVVLEN